MRDGVDSIWASYPWVIENEQLTTSSLRRVATDLGAAGFGVTDASPFSESLATMERHRETGLSGPLHFTYDDPKTATDITKTFPWARSLVVVAHNYLDSTHEPANTGPVVGRFATRDQYQAVRLITDGLVGALQSAGARTGVMIDDNRLVDRAAAARAGVGWLGRSTMLLAPGHGPWLLLGAVATDVALEPTPPMIRTCGTCVDCLPACPTGAIGTEGLDARLCISTWLQTSGSIPHWVRPLVERRVYGCDDCLTSCPPGFPALGRSEPEVAPAHSFTEMLAMSDEALLSRFDWFYVPHRDARFLRRNLLVAAGNSQEPEAVSSIVDHMDHRSSLVRGHAYWALARSRGGEAWRALMLRYGSETVPDAIRELELAMAMLRVPNGR